MVMSDITGMLSTAFRSLERVLSFEEKNGYMRAVDYPFAKDGDGVFGTCRYSVEKKVPGTDRFSTAMHVGGDILGRKFPVGGDISASAPVLHVGGDILGRKFPVGGDISASAPVLHGGGTDRTS